MQWNVTPHVGVWIETAPDSAQASGGSVTPHVGVWIETLISILRIRLKESHLM